MSGSLPNTKAKAANVRYGSWLCENAKPLNRDRRSYSSKTVLVAQRANGFDLEIELKNIILRRISIFEFLHSQGQSRRFGSPSMTSGFLSKADTVTDGRHVSKVPACDMPALARACSPRILRPRVTKLQPQVPPAGSLPAGGTPPRPAERRPVSRRVRARSPGRPSSRARRR